MRASSRTIRTGAAGIEAGSAGRFKAGIAEKLGAERPLRALPEMGKGRCKNNLDMLK